MLNIIKTYSDNPFIDELVYYVKLLAANCVVKNEQDALNEETLESSKAADVYIACIENRAIFELLDFPSEVLIKTGIQGDLYEDCIKDKNAIPKNLREKAITNAMKYTIDNYVELNEYYRMIMGLPALGFEGVYLEPEDIPKGIEINYNIPIHKLSETELYILETEGIMNKVIDRYPEQKYLRYINKHITAYDARKAMQFQLIHLPQIDSDIVRDKFRLKYDVNRDYTLRTIYSEAFKYDSDYYDNLMIIFILLMTMIDLLGEVQEHIARRDVIDARCIQFIFNAFGVPYYEEIPLKYQTAMLKNLHTLLKYKSSYKCMVDICSLFGFDDVNVFKYFLLRDRNLDENGEYQFNYKKELKITKGQEITLSKEIALITAGTSIIKIPFPFDDFIEKGNALKIKLDGTLLSEGTQYRIMNGDELHFIDASILAPGSQLEFNFYYNESSVDSAPITSLNDYAISTTTSKCSIEEDGQTAFIIQLPHENYDGSIRLVIGSLWINPNQYSIEFDKDLAFVTFKEEPYWSKAGREIVALFVYSDSKSFSLKNKVVSITNNGMSQSSIMVPEPYENYCACGNMFYIDIAGTYISKTRYGTGNSGINANALLFLDSADMIAANREVVFNMPYIEFEDVELVSEVKDIVATEYGQTTFPLDLPFENYIRDGYQIYVKYADTMLKDYQFEILKDNLIIKDESMGLPKGSTLKVIYVYPKDRDKDLMHVEALQATSDFQQRFTIPFPFKRFLVRKNFFYITINGAIVDSNKYEITDNELYIYNIADAPKKDEDVIFFFFYRENNTYNIVVTESSTEAKEDGQKVFAIDYPFFDYSYIGHGLFVTLGSVLLDESRYTIDGDTLVITDDTFIEQGRSLTFTFIYHSIFDSFVKYIDTSSQTYDITKESSDNSLLVPYPFENYLEQGNKMIVTIGDHTLEPKEYDLFGDYIIFPDMDSLLVYGNTVKFDFIYNAQIAEEILVDDNEKNYELKFVKVPLSSDVDSYLKNRNNFLNYDNITYGDPLWDGEHDHEEIKRQILDKEFSYTRTKYISLDTVFELTNICFDLPYFFNMIFDDVLIEERLKLPVPVLNETKEFKMNDIFVYLIAMTYLYNGLEDDIVDTTGKVLYIKGFNFRADIMALKDYIESEGFTMEELGIDGWQDGSSTISSYKQFLNLFTNNKNVYNHVIKQMANAPNKRIYDIYKTIYDSLMIVECNQKFFQLETGSTPKTYTDYLHYRDSDLYNSLIYIKSITDEKERQTYIFNMCDDVIFFLDQYINTDEYKTVFSRFPSVSIDYIKKYVELVINFFKSYKVELLGITTVYKLGDKYTNYIKPIDIANLSIDFLKSDNIIVKDCLNNFSNLTKEERVKVLEKVYLEISRWCELHYKDNVTNNIVSKIYDIVVSVLYKEDISSSIVDTIGSFILTEGLHNNMILKDECHYKSILDFKEKKICFDKVYISRFN